VIRCVRARQRLPEECLVAKVAMKPPKLAYEMGWARLSIEHHNTSIFGKQPVDQLHTNKAGAAHKHA